MMKLGRRKATVGLGVVLCLALAGSAVAGPVNFTPLGYAGYASAGFTTAVLSPLTDTFMASDPNSGAYVSGTLTSGVLKNTTTGDYLFYYTITMDAGSDAIDAFQLTNYNPPMDTEAINIMGYNSAVTGANANLIPTTAMVWEPPGPPFARYGFDTGVGVPGGYTTEVFYIASIGLSTEIIEGTATLINSVSAQVEAQVNALGIDQGPIVPEPTTMLLIGAGLFAMGFARRRR